MGLQLLPFCNARLTLARPIDLGITARGHRMVAEITDARFTGERFSAQLTGSAAADWYTRSPDGTIGVAGVRLTLRTVDGANVLFVYAGRLDTAHGAAGSTAYVAGNFETGDDRYHWLNRIQVVGKGVMALDVASLGYEFYQLH